MVIGFIGWTALGLIAAFIAGRLVAHIIARPHSGVTALLPKQEMRGAAGGG